MLSSQLTSIEGVDWKANARSSKPSNVPCSLCGGLLWAITIEYDSYSKIDVLRHYHTLSFFNFQMWFVGSLSAKLILLKDHPYLISMEVR